MSELFFDKINIFNTEKEKFFNEYNLKYEKDENYF